MDIILGPTTKPLAFLHVYLYDWSGMGWNGLFQLEATYNDDKFRADKVKGYCYVCCPNASQTLASSGIAYLSRKPVLAFDHLLAKEMIPYIQPEPPLVQI